MMTPKYRLSQKVNHVVLGSGVIEGYSEMEVKQSADIPSKVPPGKYYTYRVRLDLDNTIVIVGENELEPLEL